MDAHRSHALSFGVGVPIFFRVMYDTGIPSGGIDDATVLFVRRDDRENQPF